MSTHMVESAAYRDAMSRVGAAVNVITTDGPQGCTGFTATAVCSVSDSPPTLLICVNRQHRAGESLRENGVFCVNVLRSSEDLLADVFAGRTGAPPAQRFETGSWSRMETGSPVLDSAIVSMECRLTEIKSVASHDIYFATVEAVHHGQPGPALIYYERLYGKVNHPNTEITFQPSR